MSCLLSCPGSLINSQKIEPKHCTKYLGVIIDEHLSFNKYVNTLKQTLTRANGILAKLMYYATADILKNNLLCTLQLLFSTSVELETDVCLSVCVSVTKLWGTTKSC